MKKIALYSVITVCCMIFSGCCHITTQKLSDGKHYTINWCQYDRCNLNDSGVYECFKEGQFIQNIAPLTPSELKEYYITQKLYAQAVSEGLMTQDEAKLHIELDMYKTRTFMRGDPYFGYPYYVPFRLYQKGRR